MHTNNTRLFVFAHQDDEFGVFQCIKQAVQEGEHVYCAYLTDGGPHRVQRNRESLYVLAQLGVHASHVFFAGETLGIKDGFLEQHLLIAAAWVKNWFSKYTSITSIYIAAWEGGHPDHDALHALTLYVANQVNLLQYVWQFPLYNNHACRGHFFKVLSPLLKNGIPRQRLIPWRNRLHFLRLCLCYPSQAKTWLGLLPFVMHRYLFHGTELTQPVSLKRLLTPPHEGTLYYEKRGFSSWKSLNKRVQELFN